MTTEPSPPEPTQEAAGPPPTTETAPTATDVVSPPQPESVPPVLDKRPPQTVAPEAPVPFEPRDTQEMFRYARFLAMSELVPKALRGKPYDVLLVLLKAHDIGLRPIQAVGSVHVVDGKAELSAQLMVALVRKSGLCEYWQLIESTAEGCTYETLRKGDPAPVRMTYTIQDATTAGLAGKDNWRRMPKIMLRRRCQSELAREVYPEIVLGMYDEGELTEMRDGYDAPDAPWRGKVAPIAIEVGGVVDVGSGPMVAKIPSGKRDPMRERLAERKIEREKAPVTGSLFATKGSEEEADWMARGDYPTDDEPSKDRTR